VSGCRYSGATEGVTLIRKPDDYKISKTAQEHEVTRLLGGKAATEMVYGLVDMGTNNDLRGAFNLVTEFIDDYCSYGFDAFERNNSSGYLLEKRDRMVADEINKYYGQAKQVIAENRAFLDMITQGLVEKKTLTRKDIEIIRDRVAETEGKCYNQGSTKICTYKEG
jgi:cell division protease FtsH